jgi:hypothetical protein
VANAFATSVGSKAIPMWGALCIAAVFEFAGALGLGAAVTKTISGGIAKTAAFKGQPDVFMYGMLCALTAACVWVLVATYFSLPVSTTHAIGAFPSPPVQCHTLDWLHAAWALAWVHPIQWLYLAVHGDDRHLLSMLLLLLRRTRTAPLKTRAH